MRILSLSTFGRACGIADYNSDLAKSVKDQGDTFEIEPINTETIGRLGVLQGSRIFRDGFFTKLDAYDAAVVQHEFGFFGRNFRSQQLLFIDVLRGLKKSGKPSIIFMHTNFPVIPKTGGLRGRLRTLFYDFLQNQIARLINGNPRIQIFVHGQDAKARLMAAGIKSERVTSILFPAARLSSQTLPTKDASPSNNVTLAIFGFIGQYKGYETALTALRILPDNFRLVIVGDRHPQNTQDRTLDAIYGYLETGRWLYNSVLGFGLDQPGDKPFASLRSRVEITGYIPISEVESTLDSADIVLAPYTEHGPAGSSALSWALAKGKPIIASAVQAFREIGEQTGAVKLVTPNSPFELAAAIKRLVDRPEDRDRLADAAARFARENSWESVAEKVTGTLKSAA
ncbi:MAG: glycosyltransferase [Afipia sp.]